MRERTLGSGGLTVSAIGLGCMGLVDGYYGTVTEEQARTTVLDALRLGVTLFDTADSYGGGESERRLGRALGTDRANVLLASKFGLVPAGDPTGRVVDGRPENVRASIDASLQRLNTDYLDLYQLHRIDPDVDVEETVGAMAELVTAGKVRFLGLSEVSAKSLRRATSVHPIASLQSEYSVFERGVEGAVLTECDALGVGFLAFAPLGKGLLTGALQEVRAFPDGDLRNRLPRHSGQNLRHNQQLVASFTDFATSLGISAGQLALAWLLARAPWVVPLPGTRSKTHLAENVHASEVELSPDVLGALDAMLTEWAVSGDRYPLGWRLPLAEAESDR
jgi:aryl-alcohol dehydrogenase-like predicted oxidoreductase